MSGIGRRVCTAVKAYSEIDYETSATALFQAIDATGRKRFPNLGNGARFKKLLANQEDIISATATSSVHVGINCNRMTMPEAMWKLGRNPLLHEAELDKRLMFNNADGMLIGHEWNLPPSFLLGMAVGVMSAKENTGETEILEGEVSFWGWQLKLQSLWGGEDFLRSILKM